MKTFWPNCQSYSLECPKVILKVQKKLKRWIFSYGNSMILKICTSHWPKQNPTLNEFQVNRTLNFFTSRTNSHFLDEAIRFWRNLVSILQYPGFRPGNAMCKFIYYDSVNNFAQDYKEILRVIELWSRTWIWKGSAIGEKIDFCFQNWYRHKKRKRVKLAKAR